MFKPYYHKNYDGGLNDTASPTEINRNEASYLRNWDITYPGKLVQRPGLLKIGNTIAGNPITGLGAFIRSNGRDLMASETTNLYYLNSSTWTKIADNLTAGTPLWMENVQILGKIFVANEDNSIRIWDHSSTILNACLVDLGNIIPHGNVLRWHKNHMFALNNVNVSGTKYPKRVHWSNMGDPTTWDPNDYFDVPGDGRTLTGIDLGDTLVIFNERSIQYLSGWGTNSWKITTSSSNVANVSEKVGLAGMRAATPVGDEIWFVDDEGAIRRVTRTDNDAFRHDIISTKIATTLSEVNKSMLPFALAWSHNNKVYFAYANGIDLTNSIVCVFDILAARREAEAGRKPEAWTVYEGWYPNIFLSYASSAAPDLYFGDARSGIIYKIDQNTVNDDGVAIDCRWDGKNDYYDNPDRWKNYGYGRITAQSQSGVSNVDIYASIDQSPFAKIATVESRGTGSTLGPTGTFRLGPTGDARVGSSRQIEKKYFYDDGGLVPSGRALMMSIRHNALNETAQVNTWSSWFKTRQAR